MVRISQCMIAKNEEGNIETALSSLKDVVFEQIVVDTGSSDCTAVIAEELGAKVYSFDWCGDFSAAKNYAIDKAAGEWILFGDADEYFMPEDAQKIQDFIAQIEANPETKRRTLAISLACVNIDDRGNPMTKASIVRIFRNIPDVHYKGRIHEELNIKSGSIAHAADIKFMHTGYSEAVSKEKGKAERNIELLRIELADAPDNLNLKAYLADSLSSTDDEKNRDEAARLFDEVINSKDGPQVNSVLRVKAFTYYIKKYLEPPADPKKSEEICRKALHAYPGTLDFGFYLAKVLSMQGKHEQAWEQLKIFEKILLSESESAGGSADFGPDAAAVSDASIMITADPITFFCQMIITAQGLGDIENVVLYSLHVLSIDSSRMSVLGPCIANLVHYGVSNSEIAELLSNVYDFNDKGDVNTVAEAAKNVGAKTFADWIKG